MFKIIYNTLVRPSQIALHVDEKPFRKFLEFIVVMILLAIIPVFIAQSKSLSFSNDESVNIKTNDVIYGSFYGNSNVLNNCICN